MWRAMEFNIPNAEQKMKLQINNSSNLFSEQSLYINHH